MKAPANGLRTLLRTGGSILIVLAITALYARGALAVNSTTIALTYLLATLGIATTWGLAEAIAASIAGALCFNYFFLPPVGRLTIDDPQNWAALIAFLITAVVASQLSSGLERRAREATRRQQEMERLYQLSRGLMLIDRNSPTAAQVAQRIAQAFDAPLVAVLDGFEDRVHRTGPEDDSLSDAQMRGVAVTRAVWRSPAEDLAIAPLNSADLTASGSIAVRGGSLSETALQAVASLAAIAMERARAEEAASHMEAARQNEAMKALLLDALAHEFKTPLTAIKAAASSLLDETPGTQEELAAVIEEETDRLDALVNETIRMARIEAGDLRLNLGPHRARDLVDSALRKLKTLIEDREIQIEMPENLADVLADGELTDLTIRQLLTNALKYSNPEGAIRIQAWQESGKIGIGVKDSGPGIPASELAHVFEKYYRAPTHATRVPGTGLGLSIAREIIRAHGGEIWVESAQGNGTEFRFTLPTAEGQ